MYFQKVISENLENKKFEGHLAKRAGSGSRSDSQLYESRIRIKIHIKMSRNRNTDYNDEANNIRCNF